MYKLNLKDPLFLPHCGCHIQLSLEPGEVTVLIGENGIGKSTLVHRFYQDHGSLMTLVDQRPLDIFYDRSLKKLKQILIDSREGEIDLSFFLECWNQFGLNLKEERMQSSLSGGEGQALKICLGLAAKTAIYVLDEPSHYLDEQMKIKLSKIIQMLIANKKVVLMIEHDLSWANLPINVIKLNIIAGTLLNEKSWIT